MKTNRKLIWRICVTLLILAALIYAIIKKDNLQIILFSILLLLNVPMVYFLYKQKQSE